MHMLLAGWSLLLVSVVVPVAASAANCQVAPSCGDDRAALEAACPCGSFGSPAAYRRCVRTTLRRRGPLGASSCRAGLKCIARNSICGRPDDVICCKLDGKRIGAVRPSAERCVARARPGVVCPSFAGGSVGGAFANAVDDVCADDGGCRAQVGCRVPTASIDLTTLARPGSCGTARSADDTKVSALACGGLNLGGGQSTMLESIVAAGGVNRMLVDCVGDQCVVAPTTEPTSCWDCTGAGCLLGLPQPLPNGGTSVCLVNRFVAPVSGHIDRAAGSTTDLAFEVASTTFLTGTAGGIYSAPDTVCPVCQRDGEAVAGSPAAPAEGTCNGGERAGLPCTSTNPDGLSRDCLPGGVCMPGDSGCAPGIDTCAPGELCRDDSLNLGPLLLDMTLTTGTASRTSTDGLFCPGQGPTQVGCFGRVTATNLPGFQECRTIEVDGAPAGGPLVPGVPAEVTLATAFCVPRAPDSSVGPILDISVNLPGPGALSIPATLTFNEPGVP